MYDLTMYNVPLIIEIECKITKKIPHMQVFVGFFGLEGMILLFYHLNHFRRDTSDDGIGGHIFGHHGSGGNDGVFPDGHTLQDGNVRPFAS